MRSANAPTRQRSSGKGAGGNSPAYLRRAARGSAEVRKRAEVTRHQQRRSRCHLHGHDAGTGHCPAGLRAHWRNAFRHLRRIRRPRHRGPRERFRHASPSSRRTPAIGAATRSSSSARSTKQWPHATRVKHVVVYRRTGSQVEMMEGRDHWWHDLVAQGTSPECPAEHTGFRGPALHPLHLRHHRQTQRPGPHDRRLCGADVPHQQAMSSICATKTSTGARPTSAGLPGTPMSCMARCRTAPPC